jgi:hypothetical protein
MYAYFDFLIQTDKWSPSIHLEVLPWHVLLDEC